MTRPVEIISTVGYRRRWMSEEKVEIRDEAFGSDGALAATSDRRGGVSRTLIYLPRQARGQESVTLRASEWPNQ